MPLTLREKFIKYPRAVLRTVFIIIINCMCIPTYAIWMVMLLPLRRLQPNIYYKIEGIFFHWLLAVVSSWLWSAGYDVVELGDDIRQCVNHRTLVIANHQSTADVPLMMSTFNTRNDILPNIMWIMDRLFKYTNFGIVSLIHEDFFIASGKSNRDDSVILLKKHILDSYIPRQRKWMVLFPEGGFLRKRREVSQRYAQKNNLPVLNNVTLPRIGAMKAICEILGPTTSTSNNNSTSSSSSSSKTVLNGDVNKIKTTELEDKELEASTSSSKTTAAPTKTSIPAQPETTKKLLQSKSSSNKNVSFDYVLDITIAYPDGVPVDLPNIIHGIRDPCQTYFFYRLYSSTDLPKDTDSLTKWLYDRFVEKEEILNGFYKSGSFLFSSANTPTIVQQDFLRYLIIHIFFLTSTYFHIQMFYTLFNYYNMYVFSSMT